mgnify:CR=1
MILKIYIANHAQYTYFKTLILLNFLFPKSNKCFEGRNNISSSILVLVLIEDSQIKDIL